MDEYHARHLSHLELPSLKWRDFQIFPFTCTTTGVPNRSTTFTGSALYFVDESVTKMQTLKILQIWKALL